MVKAGAVTVRVPGSTSNVGPGFDTLGVAFRLYNFVRISPARGAGAVRGARGPVVGKGARMVREAAALFFARARVRPFEVDVRVGGEVPVARGLGSSVTVRLGVVAGLNELVGAHLSRQNLLELVTDLEGHPDNAAPAVLGGFTAASVVGKTVRWLRVAVPARVRFVSLIPDFEVDTEQARLLLPKSYSRTDVVHNVSRAACISAAFAAGNYAALRGMFADRIHQPYRQKLIPLLPEVIRAGEEAGALGGWLSGSGSIIMCLALGSKAAAVGRAMKACLPGGKVRVLVADNRGYRVV